MIFDIGDIDREIRQADEDEHKALQENVKALKKEVEILNTRNISYTCLTVLKKIQQKSANGEITC